MTSAQEQHSSDDDMDFDNEPQEQVSFWAININPNATHQEDLSIGEQLEVRTAAVSGSKGETTLYAVVGDSNEEYTLCTLSGQCPQFSLDLQFQITETPVKFGVRGPGKITLVGARHTLFDDDDDEEGMMGLKGEEEEDDELMNEDVSDEEPQKGKQQQQQQQQQQKGKPQQQKGKQEPQQKGKQPEQPKGKQAEKKEEKSAEKPQQGQQKKGNQQNNQQQNKGQKQQNGEGQKKNEQQTTPKNKDGNQKRPITPGNEQTNNKKQKL